MARNRVLAALRAQRRATISRLAGLDDPQWDCPVREEVGPREAPPSIRDLAAHLILADEAVLSTRALMTRVRRGGDHRWDETEIARHAGATPGQILATLSSLRDRVQRIAGMTLSVAGAVPVRGTIGRQPLEQWWCRRVLHEWLHEQDIAEGVGEAPRTPAPVVAETITTAVLRDLPVLALPSLGVTHGRVRLIVDVVEPDAGDDAPVPTAPPGRKTWSIDFARKHYGPRVAGLPDATVWLHASGLGLLAGGRRGIGELERSRLRVDGDWELATTVLDAICTGALAPAERAAAG